MRSPSSNANITSQHEFEKMLPPPAFVNSIPPARVTLTAEVRQPTLSLPPSPLAMPFLPKLRKYFRPINEQVAKQWCELCETKIACDTRLYNLSVL